MQRRVLVLNPLPAWNVVRLEDRDAQAVIGEQRAGAQPADTGADDHDVGVVALGARAGVRGFGPGRCCKAP
jgi:hypothetical protein